MIISGVILYQILLASTLFLNKVLLAKIANNLDSKNRWKLVLDILSVMNIGKIRRIFGYNSTNYLQHLNDTKSKHAIMLLEEPLFVTNEKKKGSSLLPYHPNGKDDHLQLMNYKLMLN